MNGKQKAVASIVITLIVAAALVVAFISALNSVNRYGVREARLVNEGKTAMQLCLNNGGAWLGESESCVYSKVGADGQTHTTQQ